MEETEMTRSRVVVIGGSAGSLEVLLKILPRIAIIPDFAIVIILHRKNSEDNTLEELIAIKTMIPVVEVEDKTPLLPGAIYICPSDYHLLFEKNGTLSLDISEKINYSRPSIDLSFESAADAYGNALTGILLSGANADGTAGLKAIRALGGTTIIQKPETADMPFMPRNAQQFAAPHYSFDANEILEYIKGM
ncbi:chemotaxis protein CheB [Flavobacterium magnum]|uniref:protein-glutamate methylesterase n=1 Tax=Flavobacterium magnum TaxID=2162713 RepID=A0A2S0REL1_9FLAO|nr:chemotaxis protein CheB [Flavobacterium magnum]AWA30203.1 chemotaxis protein CheB [Flavobacterium magnum]